MEDLADRLTALLEDDSRVDAICQFTKSHKKTAPLPGGKGGGDDRARLLYALRPFLSPEKQSAVDQAAGLLEMGGLLLTVMQLGGMGHGGLRDAGGRSLPDAAGGHSPSP